MEEGLQSAWNSIKGGLENVFSEENFKNLAHQVKSAFTEENWDNMVTTIRNGLKDVTDKEKIKTILESVKGQIKDTTGNVGKMIQCLENDINDSSCLKNLTNSAYTIQGANLFATVLCGLFILFLINFAFGRRLK